MEEHVPEVIICANCTEIISSLYMACAECPEEPFPVRICLPCFASGAEPGAHSRGHNYRVKDSGGVPVFGPSTAPPPAPAGDLDDKPSTSKAQSGEDYWRIPWVSSEETALLDSVERFNLGNWEAVALAVNPRRSAAEVKEHYDKLYLRGRLGAATAPAFHRRPPPARQGTPPPMNGCTAPLGSPPIRASATRINADDLRLLAYMPHRDDFEKEWKNEAEHTVADLMLTPGEDDELDRAVKLSQVDMYLREVAERRRMKAIARDYDLVNAFLKQERPPAGLKSWKYSPQQMKEMKVEKELREALRKSAQLMPAADFDALIAGLLKEKLLKERVEELQGFRKKGVKTLEGRRKFQLGGTPRKRRVNKRISFNSNAGSALKKWERMRRWQKKFATSA